MVSELAKSHPHGPLQGHTCFYIHLLNHLTMGSENRFRQFNPKSETFAQFLMLLRIYFVAENITVHGRQAAFLFTHCLTPAMQRHCMTAGAARAPPLDMPCTLDQAAEIMPSFGSALLRSSGALRKDLKSVKSDGSDIYLITQ